MQVLCLLPQEAKAVYGSPLGECKCCHVKIHHSPSFLHVMAKCQLDSGSILLGPESIGKGCILKLRNAFLVCPCFFNFHACFIHKSNNSFYMHVYLMQVLFISICSQINRERLLLYAHTHMSDSLKEKFFFLYKPTDMWFLVCFLISLSGIGETAYMSTVFCRNLPEVKYYDVCNDFSKCSPE